MRDLLYLVGHMPKADGRMRWFESDEGNERLARDRALIRSTYPNLKYGLNYGERKVFLDGTITLRAECGVPTHIKTRIVFPDGYPRQEPMAFETGKMFQHIADRHFYLSGMCCLWLPIESQWHPQKATALQEFLDHLSTFFERQLIYDASPDKQWAWGQRGHNIGGYIEFFQEILGGSADVVNRFVEFLTTGEKIDPASACSCKSGKRFKYCHQERVEKLIQRLSAFISARR